MKETTLISGLMIIALFGLHMEPAQAKEDELCVSTKDGVVHITSTSTPGASCKRELRKRNQTPNPDESQLKLLAPQTPLARFSTANQVGMLTEAEGSPLSGTVGAALEIWMRLNERATDAVDEPFVVLQYGDSHSQGGTFSDQFRKRLAHDPISPGFVSSGFPMNWGVRVTRKGKWKRRNWLRDRKPSFGPLGIVFDSRRPGDELHVSWGIDKGVDRGTVAITVVFDARMALPSFELHANNQQILAVQNSPIEGELPEQVVVDPQSGLGLAVINLSAGTSSLTLTSGGDTSKSNVLSIYGFLIQFEKASLEWNNLGVSGTEIKHLVARGDDSVEAFLKWKRPDLFLAWFGTNSLNDPKLTVSGYRDLYRTYLNRLAKAMPHTACLVVGPPDFMKRPRSCFLSSQELKATKGRRTRWKRGVLAKNRRRRVCEPDRLVNPRKRGRYRFPVPGVMTMEDWQAHRAACEFKTVPLMEEIIAVQKAAAHEAGCLYFDTYKFMGGSGGIHRWACKATVPEASLDHIHLNTAGYRKLADGIVDELNRALDRLNH